MRTQAQTREVRIPAGGAVLDGTLTIPPEARGVVLFAHVSGSSRSSPRNRYVAGELQAADFATLLLDLLTPGEERVDEVTRHHRFDIPMLARRLVSAIDWLAGDPGTRDLPVGCFGASTGAAAALMAAADRPARVRAVVSRAGRPDLAGAALQRVRAATLLIVGGRDAPVLTLNNQALRRMLNARARLRIVAGATHLFDEPGTLEQVAAMARDWFRANLAPAADRTAVRALGAYRRSDREGAMASSRFPGAYLPDPECGVPGGGRGRRDEVGGSGVYPASAGCAPPDAVRRTQAEWGQGDRGAEGYDEAGGRGLYFYPVELRPPSAARTGGAGGAAGADGPA